MPGVYADDALLAMYVRVGIMAIERFADRTDDSFLCSGLDLTRLAGCEGVANAKRKLGRLEAETRLSLGREGAGWRLTFPNFAKKHGFKRGNGAETVSYADADADVRKEKSQRGVRKGCADTTPRVSAHPEPNREPHYPNDTESPSFEVPAPSPAGSHTQSPVKSPRRNRAPRADPSPESEAAFDLLLWAIDQSTPGASIPDAGSARWRRWCQELDRLHRLGERGGEEGFSWEEIGAVIHWLPTHQGSGDFCWGRVIRSASKLRQHFARLLAECKARGRPTRSSGWRDAAKQVHQSIMETGDG